MRSEIPNGRTVLTLGLGALTLLAATHTAHAQTNPNCNDATMFPNPIYLAGSSAFEPTAGKIAVKLSAQTTKYTLIYKATASCDGPAAIVGNVTLTGNGDTFTVDPADATKVVTKQCSLDATATKADIGACDVSYDACTGTAVPSGVADFSGPVQAMEFIVPEVNTTITAISSEQAAAIWGCGMPGMVGMFTDETAIQQRNAQSGTQIMVSKYIGVPAAMMKGVMNGTGGNLVTSLLAVTSNPQAAIGFYAADGYDTKRATLNALAFRGVGQTKAYYADSTAAATDKKNVRDGHYQIFGPVHLFANVGTGTVATGNAKKAIDWIQGTAEIEAGKPLGFIDIEGGAGMVPQCAMNVKRDSDGGLLKPYTPPVKCGCYFEKVVTQTSSAACVPCTTDASCSGGKTCQSQFCELP
jgi:hypothetical protein